MKLSNDTVGILKNFASINQNLIIKEGSELTTMSAMKNIVARAKVMETFPKEVAIYDLNEFLAALSLFTTPVLDFQDQFVTMSEEGNPRNSLKYFYSDPSVVTSPSKMITMPSEEVTFTLNDDTVNQLKRAAGVISSPDLALENNLLTVKDKKNDTANNYSINVDCKAEENADYTFFFKVENLKLLGGDYRVAVSSKFISHFKNTKSDIEYWIALELNLNIMFNLKELYYGKLFVGREVSLETIDDCVLPNHLKDTFKEFVKNKSIPNIILCGSAGVGKTTVAKAMINEIGATYMMINGSEESGIDVLRTKIKNFASTVSLEGGRKYIILDEADYLNPQSTQPALRGFMEEFHKNCGFILTCNYKNRLIEPLHSRCSGIDFTINNGEKIKLAETFFVKVKDILDGEGIKYEPKAVAELINKHFPDWRRVLNELQRYSATGQIDAGVLVNISEKNIGELMHALKGKEFTNVRKWIVANLDNDHTRIYRRIYDSLYDHLDPNTIPHAVVILGDYQYKSAFVADQEINMLACLTEIMGVVKFR